MKSSIYSFLCLAILVAFAQSFDGWHDDDWFDSLPDDPVDDSNNGGFIGGVGEDNYFGLPSDFHSDGNHDYDGSQGDDGLVDVASSIDHGSDDSDVFDTGSGIDTGNTLPYMGSGVDMTSDDDVDDDDHHFVPSMNKGCSKGCARCVYGICIRCQTGYKKRFLTCVKRRQNKKSCRKIPHCRDCSGFSWIKSCKECDKGWHKHAGYFDGRHRCVKKCPRGYKPTTTQRGSVCKKVIPDGCLDYYCSMCKKGWFMVTKSGNNQCHKTCPVGYYPMGKTHCNKCKRGCAKCESFSKCTSCTKRFSLLKRFSWGAITSTRCLRRCPRGYKKEMAKGVGLVCRQVCFVANCDRCPKNGHHGLHHHCDSCKKGFHLFHGHNDQCVSSCPKGYYPKHTHIGTICRKGLKPTTKMSKSETTAKPDTTAVIPPTTQEQTTNAEPTTSVESTTTTPEATTTESETTTDYDFTTMAPEPIIAMTTKAEPDFSEVALRKG